MEGVNDRMALREWFSIISASKPRGSDTDIRQSQADALQSLQTNTNAWDNQFPSS